MTDLFTFTYYYGNGDAYTGYGYASAGRYHPGQYLGYGTNSYDNETGYDGYYYINAVSSGYNETAGSINVNAYYDIDTGYGVTTLITGRGSSGIGSESGYAYNSTYGNGDSYFSNNSEADLYYYLYTFTYYYGNGDAYTGYGYEQAGRYYPGQYLGYGTSSYDNETGHDGYYYITSVSPSLNGTSGAVYVNAYYDIDTGYGVTNLVTGRGSSGIGSESGYAYNSIYGNNDSYFSDYYEADLYP